MDESSADWYARKLGRAPSQPQGGPVIGPRPAPRQPPVFVPQGGRAVPVEQQPQTVSPQGVHIPVDEQGQVHAGDAWQVWQGKDGVKEMKELGGCPECGSPNYFARAQGVLRGPPPAPHCYDCGYPLVQAGSGMGDLANAKSTGTAHAPQAAGYQIPSGGFQIVARVT